VTGSLPDTSLTAIDSAISTLASSARSWAELPVADKAVRLRKVRSRFAEVADDMVAAGLAAKDLDDRYAGEEWASGPLGVIRTMRFLEDSLSGIAATGRVPIPDSAIRARPDGQVAVDVLPGDGWDRLLYPKWRAEVRMEPGIPLSAARSHIGGIHTKPETAAPAVAAVLGAGNVASITPLDVIHKLFVEGHVVIAKCHPINEYIGAHLEHAFAALVDEGVVRFVYGGQEVGGLLTDHGGVDEVHVTGSERTHDAIVWGTGDEAAERRSRGRPRLTKRITSELGNVSPVIVVPGRWSSRQLRHQAEHVATQVLHNAGHNCNAAEVLVLPEAWPQHEEFVDAIASAMESRPPREAYYPGSGDRFDRVIGSGSRVRVFGERRLGSVPPAIVANVDPDERSPAFGEEAFCHVLATTLIAADDPVEYLDRVESFCNERLRGTLNATLLVDPSTAKSLGPRLARTVTALRYGTVAVNVWAAAGFPLGVVPWGAYPGHTLDDVQSGVGFVHNARLIDRPEKTVIRAPFVQIPKPPWSVFHRRSGPALRAVTRFEADPGPLRLAKLLGPAMRA